MNDAKPVHFKAGINFSVIARPTGLSIDFMKGVVKYTLTGNHFTYSVERPFDPNNTADLRRLFGDDLIDRVVQTWNEYHATRFDESGLQLW